MRRSRAPSTEGSPVRRTSTLVLAFLGVLALVGAVALRFVVLPSQAQLPADVDSTSTYEGTLGAYLDTSALASGDLSSLLLTDEPVTITRHAEVTATDGDVATLQQDTTIALDSGRTLVESGSTTNVDRRTMQDVDAADGRVIGWPIGTEARDYIGWSSDLQELIALAYDGTEEHAGIETYVFRSEFDGRIVGEDVLAHFLPTLPKAMLPGIAEALSLPAALTAQLPLLMDILPDDVPMQYAVDATTTYWVDPTTGIVIDVESDEVRTAAFDVQGIPSLPLAEVFSISYSATDQTVAGNVESARDGASKLTTFGTVLPVSLAVLGVLLLIGAVVSARRAGSDSADASADSEPSPELTGA